MIDLDELERLNKYATPGPWDAEGNSVRSMRPASASGIVGTTSMAPDMQAAEDNAALIAALRNAARELIADARRYRWLRERFFSVDFGYDGGGDRSMCVVVFKIEDTTRMSGDLSASIDTAIAQERKP